MKVVILGNQARALANFWSVLSSEIVKAGHESVFCLPEAEVFKNKKNEKGQAENKKGRKENSSLKVGQDQAKGQENTQVKDQVNTQANVQAKDQVKGQANSQVKGQANSQVKVQVKDQLKSCEEKVWDEKLKRTGARLAYYHLDRKGLNPLRDFKTFKELFVFLRREKPDILFATTIKPVIYGSLAAFFSRTPKRSKRFLMITGLGYMFEADSFAKKILRRIACLLYRLAFSCSGTVYFQNPDDKKLFEDLKIIPPSIRVDMTPGTGVDIDKFSYQPYKKAEKAKIEFLLVGRLLEAKGLREYCQAAELLKKTYEQVKFSVLGPAEQGLGAFPLEELLSWQKRGIINYLGEAEDVKAYLAQADIIVLPSWREGVPVSLLEAMSTGRAVVATDVPGCREVVKEGLNGFLVPVKDYKALAQGMEKFLLEPELMIKMGREGRKKAEEKFSAYKVAAKLMQDFGL